MLQAAKEHYNLVKEDYKKHLQKLTKLVDSGVDSVEFVAISGTHGCEGWPEPHNYISA